jgi:hypothetical protein
VLAMLGLPLPQMLQTYRKISQRKAAIMASAGSNNLFEARVFEDLYFATRAAVEETRLDLQYLTCRQRECVRRALRIGPSRRRRDP